MSDLQPMKNDYVDGDEFLANHLNNIVNHIESREWVVSPATTPSDYTDPKARHIIMATFEPAPNQSEGENGDIWIMYEEPNE